MGEQLPLFEASELEREKAEIENYDKRRILITEVWCVLYEPKPISINDAYSTNGPKRFLTSAGRAFKDALAAAMSRAISNHDMPWKEVIDFVYKQGGHIELSIWLYVEDLINDSWSVGGSMTKPKNKSKEPEPRLPYRKRDADNYIKLVQDSIARATGIDDAAVLDSSIHKRQAGLPRTVLAYRVFE